MAALLWFPSVSLGGISLIWMNDIEFINFSESMAKSKKPWGVAYHIDTHSLFILKTNRWSTPIQDYSATPGH